MSQTKWARVSISQGPSPIRRPHHQASAPSADDQRMPVPSARHTSNAQSPIIWCTSVPTFPCTSLSLTQLSLTLQPFLVPSGIPVPVPSIFSKGPPILLALMEIWVTHGLTALLPLWSFQIPPRGGVACFSVPLNIFINLFLHFAVKVHPTENSVPSGYMWSSPLPRGRLQPTSSTEDFSSWLPAFLSIPSPPIILEVSCNPQHCNSLIY